jgi:hypothetical protein
LLLFPEIRSVFFFIAMLFFSSAVAHPLFELFILLFFFSFITARAIASWFALMRTKKQP